MLHCRKLAETAVNMRKTNGLRGVYCENPEISLVGLVGKGYSNENPNTKTTYDCMYCGNM